MEAPEFKAFTLQRLREVARSLGTLSSTGEGKNTALAIFLVLEAVIDILDKADA